MGHEDGGARRWLAGVPMGLLALYFLRAFFLTFPMTAYGEWLFHIIHMPPATTTIYYSVAFFPWNLKPLYGLVSDNFPIAGYHRKSYIVLCEVGAALSLFCTGTFVTSVSGAFVVKILDSVFEAFAQIMLGIFLVDVASEDATSKTSAKVQSLANGTKNAASIAALLLGIPVYKSKSISATAVICWTSVLPLVAALVCVFGLHETRYGASAPSTVSRSGGVDVASSSSSSSAAPGRIPGRESFFASLRESWAAFTADIVRKCDILLPVLPTMAFFFLCSALPGDGTVWYQYTFSLLEDHPECLQYMSLAGMVGRFLSCIMYAKWCSGRNVRHVFVASTVCSVIAGLPRLMLAPPVAVNQLPVSICTFSAAESFATAFTSEFALLQLLVVATFYCPTNKEVHGLTYALYLSFMDFGGVVSGVVTSWVVSGLGIVADPVTQLVDWRHLWVLVAISAVGQLLVLVFLCVLPEKVNSDAGTDQLRDLGGVAVGGTTERDPLLSGIERQHNAEDAGNYNDEMRKYTVKV
ncbi:Folate-biopterin transporter, partial [Globisporangium splendens]